MSSDALTAIALFLAGSVVTGVATFATVKADLKNLKGWVKEIAAETHQTALHVAALPCRSCKFEGEGD